MLKVGKYFFAPLDNDPDVVQQFQAAWQDLPSAAEGLVIDFERPGQDVPEGLLERIPVGDPRAEPPDRMLLVFRWNTAVANAR